MKSPIAPKTVLAKFESKSRPGTFYTVKLGADGVVYCDCMGWRMCHNHPSNRVCCHTREVVARMSFGGRGLVATGPEPVMDRPVTRRAAARKAAKAAAEAAAAPPARTAWERL